MPQLAKGGKYVFGWSIIGKDGGILLPEEARYEYQLEPGERVILMPGSNTSGGFSISKKSRIERSKLSDILVQNPDLAEFKIEEGKIVNVGGKLCPHRLERKPCRGGHTTWCPICRVRSFIYDN